MRSWLRRQTESLGGFRTRGSPWSLSIALFGDFLSGDLVWGYGISAADCLAIRSEKPFLHFRGPSQAPRRSAWLLKNIHFLRIRILRTDAPRRSRRRGASHHGGLWARRIHMREAQRRSPPRIIRIADRCTSCPVSQFISKPMVRKINTKAMPMRMKV